MEKFQFIRNIQDWSDQYPWLEMLTLLSLIIIFAIIANFDRQANCGTWYSVSSCLKMALSHSQILSEHSVIKRFANIVPAIVILNGITTVPIDL